MTEYFVVQTGNIEYNDENYYIQGVDKLSDGSKLHSTIEDARAEAKEILKKTLQDYKLSDLDEYDYGYNNVAGSMLIQEWLKSLGVDEPLENDIYYDEYYWSNFIEWAEKNGHEWLPSVPQDLISIAKVIINEN